MSDETISDELRVLARDAVDNARKLFLKKDTVPFTVPGDWSLADCEALSDAIESSVWHLSWKDNKITIYGDPGPVHQISIELFNSHVRYSNFKHADAPPHFTTPLGQLDLFHGLRSARHKWILAPTTMNLKEPDSFFCGSGDSTLRESGMVIHIAHISQSLPSLCEEIVDWTRGYGDRALLAVGIKIDTNEPFHKDPQLTLVVRDCTPNSTSIHCRLYHFGAGTNIVSRQKPQNNPATAVIVESSQQLEACNLEVVVPADPQAYSLIVDVPIGAALFPDLHPHTFEDVVVTDAYGQHLQSTVWKLDLGFFRQEITDIVRRYVSV